MLYIGRDILLKMNHNQVRNIVTYYLLNMLKSEQTANHITRDVIDFNKLRGQYCGKLHKKYKILHVIHQCDHITQINSVPENSVCAIENKKIPTSSYGVQLIVTVNNTIKHYTIQKKYQNMCYNYFKIRYFDVLTKEKIKNWFLDEPWFIPKTFSSNILLKHLLDSNFCDMIWTEINQILE